MKESFEDQAPKSESIADFAKKTGREALGAYIDDTEPLYNSMGVGRENFQYFGQEGAEKLEIQYTPSEIQHGFEGVVHGGISSFMIDASAGAFAMTVGSADHVALTKGTNIKFLKPVMVGIPVQIVSSMSPENSSGNKRQVLVKTEVIQNGEVRITAETECQVITKAVLDRAQRGNSK